jgi:elongation factor Ts
MDIGAQTDGLLHISQLSVDYVSDVSSILEVGQEVDVRIVNIDEKKNQVALTLLSESQEEEAKANQQQARQPRPARSSNRRDDSAVLSALAEKGWDKEAFVEGTVVSTVDFGAFVRVDASTLNSECEGQFDGLVHISALTAGRVDNVESVVKPDEKVQVRVKEIANRKVSLTMVSVEDEKTKQASFGGGAPVQVGNKNWKEDFENMQKDMPTFKNSPLVEDRRK